MGLRARTRPTCANFDATADHAVEDVEATCQECAYLTPPDTSSDDGDGRDGDGNDGARQ